MERIEANKKVIHSNDLIIPELASVRHYIWKDVQLLDIKALPLELVLFCVKQGRITLQASFIPHPLDLNQGEAIFLAFPRDEWQVKVIGEAVSEFFITRMEIGTLHTLINPSFETKTIQSETRVNMRDLMRLIPVGPALMMCYEQLFHHKLNPPFSILFEKAKFLEIFSLLMESAFGQPMDACPVAMSPAIEQKLILVRRHIMNSLDEIPDTDQLALQYELPRNTLKEGYKFKYGKTIHQFHADHKLESAMQMLSSGEMLVKEIAFKIGYQNPSHFISAFKKKFGVTPKQFLKK